MVGIGPGSEDLIAPRALQAIKRADVVVGYKTYINLLKGLKLDNEIISTGMTKEIDRCAAAIELALRGRDVAVVSGGDPGVYGMAGLVLEMIDKGNINLEVEIIPGITSANASAAKLGAPLMHDYVVISLSDLLTPWELIEKRVHAAAMADFIVVLYNPASHKRSEQIKKAVKILGEYRLGCTPVGIARNTERADEEIIITDLEHLTDHNIDMLCTVIIGNSNSRVSGRFIITPRGYKL